jgi:hypothetical protein
LVRNLAAASVVEVPASLASWVGLAVGVGALIFAWLAWRVSKKELRLAQEEAELRPDLVISLRTVVYHHRPRDPGTQYPHAAIVFNVMNDGRSAAHNVRCEISLDERHLIPDDVYGQNYPFFTEHLGPLATKQHQINAAVLSHGLTAAPYRCVCDEVGKSEGTIEFEVPEREQGGNSGMSE